MNRDATTAFARALVDEWVRGGVHHAVLSPGSRSAPLAVALAAEGRLRLHVVLDERAAAFFALGIGRATGRPAVVLCTSGTAAAEFHPAVLEAHHGRVPLLVCTADRPPELQDVGAPQTVDQQRLFGAAPRWQADVEPPTDGPGAGARWRSLAARSIAEALGPPPGPVHLNLRFREPLVPTGAPLVEAPGRPDGAPWTVVHRGRAELDEAVVDALVARIEAVPRGVLVAGWGEASSAAKVASVSRFARAARWPILADPLSGLRVGPDAVSTYDALLRVRGFAEAHEPELVVRLGAMPTSKPLARWLEPPRPVVRVCGDGAWLDPARADDTLLVTDPAVLLDTLADRLTPRADTAWHAEWMVANRRARAALDGHLDQSDELCEGRIARDVYGAVPDGTRLVVASSMPVRDLESFAAPRDGVRALANRGVNGIDGFVSTALGVAAARPARPTVALTGDLCFLHDAGGLLGAARRGLDVVFVVVDNDGGGIFSFLPQAEWPEHFEQVFGAPHGVDLGALALAHGLQVHTAERGSEVVPALVAALAAGGVQLVLARTDRVSNVARHRAAWDAVARAIDG